MLFGGLTMNKKSSFHRVLIALSLTLIFQAGKAAADECLDDMKTRVKGKENCLVIHTFPSLSQVKPSTLVIFIHGDQSDGGPVSGMIKLAQEIDVPADVIKVALLRPGYFDKTGNTSTGTNFGRKDSYTPANVDEVTAVVQALQRHYQISQTFLVGHSGGAAFTGVMIGRTPGIATAALLLSCPCDIRRWRAFKKDAPWASLSPSAFVETLPTNMKVIAITGQYDDNTKEYLAQDYIDTLVKRGVAAQFRRAVGAGHNDILNAEVVVDAMRILLSSK